MIKVGVTGNNGFLGKHLTNTLRLETDVYEIIHFERNYFDRKEELDHFVSNCDVIYHLAAMNRHENEQVIYDTNVSLVKKLVDAFNRTKSSPRVFFSSSSQMVKDNLYGQSKKRGQELFESWANSAQASVTSFVIPNVFGAFGKPFYNSFIATFCHLLTSGGEPTVQNDSQVHLIYVQNLVNKMIQTLNENNLGPEIIVESDISISVVETLSLLENFRDTYFENGIIPKFSNSFERDLFNTFRSFIDYENYFPKAYTKHSDSRGSFVELIKLQQGGQVSFSTTVPGITRGNHYHTRKIERFSVIKGKARIEMRKVDDSNVLSFEISGDKPAFVDMPIWYTHNIKNIGEEELYTIFWINEFYDPEDADTFFVEV